MDAAATPSGRRAAGPVAGDIEVLPADGELRTSTRFTVSREETVLPGHYPGFPIFPGVCLVECVHLSALATAPAGAAAPQLVTVESTRFTTPVYPEDELLVTIDWKRRDETTWQCRAKVASQRGDAASVRLRYRCRPDVGAA
ncbi:hypothetical protein JL475_26515 [Streptomyces sp. M2CJ-2]|uniref:3-hydroxyacyl-ACP dehydratase FabZ family protein n=1 Tax=Streptomyces sp. M2CJ-2 TaxID=2803948 RepID=UPI001925A9D1|nr:hypothetical protein [Streptomyces sp. M2CJ-2]MBL3669474.1 hypothetical protein [Streptomyces sp. M2CJ-2]